MDNMMTDMLDAYSQQGLAVFSPGKGNIYNWASPAQFGTEMKQKAASVLGNENAAALFYSAGGFFVDCALEAPIINTTLNPLYTLANMIPVVPTSDRKVTYGYMTSISANVGDYPDYVCDTSPTVGDPAFCKAEYELGRISYQTKTLELDALLEKANRGVREDFYLVGNIRGVSANPTMTQLRDRDFVQRSAVRRQLMILGRAFQNDVINQFWNGDPTNATMNTTHGGRKEFWGLNSLVANDYGSKTFVSGTNCASLNSYIDTFSGTVGDGTANLYAKLQSMENVLYQRAAMQGLLPVDWVIVMHPITWSEVLKYLPCEMMGDSCVRPGYDPTVESGNVISISANDGMSQVFLRNQMANTMMLPINGRTYQVVLDSGITIDETAYAAGPPVVPLSYTAPIFMIPLRVAGESVLFWRYKDYSLLESQLSPIPGSQTDMRGWSDSGRYHFIIEHSRRCFLVDGKTELGLVFNAPQLAGRIDDVTVSPSVSQQNWNGFV